jgi:hypothetical protein
MGIIWTRLVHKMAIPLKSLWKMKVLHAVKIFMWRASINALPTKANLFKRKIMKELLCPLCGFVAETTGHILWGCQAAKDVWSICGRKIQIRSIEHENFVAVIETLLHELKNKEVEFVAIGERRLWLCHNVVVHGGTLSHLSLLVSNASKSLEAFCNANSCMKTRVEVDHNMNLKCLASLEGFLKVNRDAAVDRRTRKMGIEVII